MIQVLFTFRVKKKDTLCLMKSLGVDILPPLQWTYYFCLQTWKDEILSYLSNVFKITLVPIFLLLIVLCLLMGRKVTKFIK